MKTFSLALALTFVGTLNLLAQISFAGGIYSQNFNSLASSGFDAALPAGWTFAEFGMNSNGTYEANHGSNNAGNTYSYGAIGSSERALGCLASGNLVSVIGANFINSTGGPLSALAISYTGEQWRRGDGDANTLAFAYSTNATSLTSGTWTSVSQLNFTSPTTSGPNTLDGNAAANSAAVGHIITGVNIPAGAAFWIRWSDNNDIGADDGLAIDDFTLEMAILPIQLASFAGDKKGSSIHLSWRTATEQNNDYMAVERSADGAKFDELGRVKGAGTTQEPQAYTFTDYAPLRGLNYYRLRQVDYDGAFEYHQVISVLFDGKETGLGIQAFPNPVQDQLQARWAAAPDVSTTLRLLDMTGRQLATYKLAAGVGAFEVPLNVLPAGLYFLEVRQGQETGVLRFRKE